MHGRSAFFEAVFAALALFSGVCQGDTFRVATFNLEGYLDQPTESRRAKTPESKRVVCESICAMRPDVLALQEMGTTNALLELQQSLKKEGLDLPYWEHVAAHDTNVHLAVLSRFPFSARRSHKNDNFLLGGRRFHVGRGFVELDIRVNTNYSFTLMAAHLKSKRPVASGDEAELRLEEAKLLREKIDARLAADPNLNLLVVGDFNDTKASPSTRTIVGLYRNRLIDTRPAERNPEDAVVQGPEKEGRRVTWTHYYAQDDTFSRIDFLLLSRGMAREWITEESYVLALPDWGQASDHRPVTALFEACDR